LINLDNFNADIYSTRQILPLLQWVI